MSPFFFKKYLEHKLRELDEVYIPEFISRLKSEIGVVGMSLVWIAFGIWLRKFQFFKREGFWVIFLCFPFVMPILYLVWRDYEDWRENIFPEEETE